MSPLSLHCTVCDTDFGGRKRWTRHLFQEGHQNRARIEFGKWEEAMKECALVTFFSCPVNEGNEEEDDDDGGGSNLVVLLWKYLKRTVDGNAIPGGGSPLLITDFVWWKERPTMAVLQFESREKVDQVYIEILKVGGATQEPVKIGNRLVSFKKLVDFPDMEWKNLHPGAIQVSRSPQPVTSSGSPMPSTSQGPPPVIKRKITASSSLSSYSSDDLTVSTKNENQPNATNIPTNSSALIAQFDTILKSVEIPPSEFQQAIQITEQVKTLLSSEFPSCQVLLFRHNFLKVQNPFCNDLLIFAQDGRPTPTPITISQVAKLAVVQDPTLFWLIHEDKPKYKDSQLFQQAESSSGSPFYFWVLTDPAYLLEVQLNRLLEYMLTFDPKCSLVLLCIHYFCATNSCYFGDSPSKSEAIEWLLIFFLSREKVIPTVRQILDQPHQPIMLPNSGRNIDIGFNPDPDYATKWALALSKNRAKEMENFEEEFVCDVLRLFEGFLDFVGRTLRKGRCILNTRDAEILNRKQMLFEPRPKWTTELSAEEIEIIKSSPLHGGPTSNKWPFSIVHPLAVHLNLGYNLGGFWGASKIMKRGRLNLNRFLNQRDRRSSDLDRRVKKKEQLPEIYNDLENVLKIEIVYKESVKKGKDKGRRGKNKKAKKGSGEK